MDWRGSSEGYLKAKGYWSSVKRGKFGKKAICHPEKTHYAKGMCKPCYYKHKWDTDEEWRKKQQDLSRIREQKRPARIKNTDDYKAKRDAKFYNLLPGERQRIWDFQKGLDPISGLPLVPRANMDHCHITGLVRGLLNPITNRKLVDNIALLKSTLAYLENPPAPQALEEKVYGLIGRAQNKKKMLYGPSKTPQPIQRAAKGK